MTRLLLLLTALCLGVAVQAQTYSDDVAPIFFDKCTQCHHNGGIAPFPLMSYNDALPWVNAIRNEVSSKSMPPWPIDNSYSQFSHDRSLSTAEINTIVNWVNAGAPQGNPNNTPAPPVYNVNNWRLGTPDLSLRMPNYASQATANSDDYICISIPTNLVGNRIIKSIEVVPGNPEIVHHVLLYLDANGTYVTDTTSHSCGGPSNLPLIGGYAPGSDPLQFINTPNLKLGVNVPANSHIVLAMHYPFGSQGQLDSTRVNLHFYPQGTSGVRPVSANPLIYDYLFSLNANTVSTLDGWFPSQNFPIGSDYTIYSIFPHAHLLGQSFLVYGVNHSPPFDTIPLIHIPEWDFDWQGFYIFKYLQKLPAGYKLYGKAVYDNTTNNPFNPNSPPQNVSFGENTTDEMFLIYFQYLPYQAGDEFVHTDSLLRLQNSQATSVPLAQNEGGIFLTTYPNPSRDWTTIHYYNQKDSKTDLSIYNIQGIRVRQIHLGQTAKGEHRYQWDGKSEQGSSLPPGVYTVRLATEDRIVTRQIIRH